MPESPSEVEKKIAKKLEMSLRFHRDKREAVKGLDPAMELREIGAINALETLWLQLLSEGLITCEEGFYK